MSDQDEHSIATFAALKTAIANGEELLVKELLANQPMQALEKSYLIDLATFTNTLYIIQLLQNVPLSNK